MASICDDPNGRRRILFVAADGSRKCIRLGKVDRKTAEGVCRQVEALLSSKMTGEPLPRTTASWLNEIGDELQAKLAAVGLVEPVRNLTVGEFVGEWLTQKDLAGCVPATILVLRQSIRELKSLFAERTLTSLVHADGERLRKVMLDRGLARSTVAKRLGHARQILEDAVRLNHLQVNPFRYVRQRQGDPGERRAYIPVADVARVIDNCPDVWWRLLVALARFGGLRTPSEPFSMTWADVDWERSRLVVRSPKTIHQGKGCRTIPMFPLLREHLEDAFEVAEEGAVYIFPEELRKRAQGPTSWVGCNLRTTMRKIILRAGMEPWPRLWHNLRASLESDLAQAFPLATVTKWLGNTPSVALRHYVDPTEEAFTRAMDWRPFGSQTQESGAESGALVAQNQAQQTNVAHDKGTQPLTQGKGRQKVMRPIASDLNTLHICSKASSGMARRVANHTRPLAGNPLGHRSNDAHGSGGRLQSRGGESCRGPLHREL